MKIPIELIGSRESLDPRNFSIDDVYAPLMPAVFDTTAGFGAFISSILQRLSFANDKSTQLSSYVQLTKYKLEELDANSLDLDLTELIKLLDQLEELVDNVSVLKFSMNDVITKHLLLSSQTKRYSFQATRSTKKLEEIGKLLVEQIEVLSQLNKGISRVDAWERNSSIGIYEVLAEGADIDLHELADKILSGNTSYRNIYFNRIPELVNKFEIILSTLISYECFVDNLLLVISKLTVMYDKLYLKTHKTWLRLIGGSYIREGQNILLNRFCGIVTVKATAPPLTECDPPRYLAMPPPDVQILDPQMPDCPECIPVEEEEDKYCKVVVFDGNANAIIDDDLELFVDDKFVGEFKGTTSTESKYSAIIPAGKGVKFEFKFKKSNNRNTVKEIKIETESEKKLILKDTVSCPSSAAVGSTIWSKTVSVECSGDDAVNLDGTPYASKPTTAPTTAPPTTLPPGSFTSDEDCESLYTTTFTYSPAQDDMLSDQLKIGFKQSDDEKLHTAYLGIVVLVTYQADETIFPYSAYVYPYYTTAQKDNILGFYRDYQSWLVPYALAPHRNFTKMDVYEANGEAAKRILNASDICINTTISDEAELNTFMAGASVTATYPGHRFNPDIVYN